MGSRFQRVQGWVAGEPEQTPLTHRILNLLTFLGLFQAGFFLVSDLVVGQVLLLPLLDLTMLAFFGLLYREVRWVHRFFPGNHVFSVAAVALPQLNFYVNAGIDGPGLLVILTISVMLTFLHPGRLGLVYAGINLALTATALLVEYEHPEWITGYQRPGAQLLDIGLTFLLVSALVVLVGRWIMRFHQEVLEQSRQIQAAAAQSEQMASLGEMVAGLGHEVGTPVGVLLSCLNLTRDWWTQDLPRFRAVWDGLDDAQRDAFVSLVAAGLEVTDDPTPDSRAARAQRDALAAQLVTLNVDRGRSLAEDLAGLDLLNWDPAWVPLTKGESGRAGWDYAVKLLVLNRSNRLAHRAAGRIQNLVGALAAYSRNASESGPVPTDLAASLDNVLTLYGAVHKNSVEVVRHYETVPPVLAQPEALVQVWTNLVQNALQAMGGQGTLTIRLVREGASAVVTVDDTGPGVPEDLRERIFQIFFTTKERGSGTGMGLAIVRKIVLAHHGTVRVTEAPGGGARFEVRLPLPG